MNLKPREILYVLLMVVSGLIAVYLVLHLLDARIHL
jgi:hypothetical protein